MKRKQLNIRLDDEDSEQIEYLVQKAKVNKTKVIKKLIKNAYDLVKSVTNEKS